MLPEDSEEYKRNRIRAKFGQQRIDMAKAMYDSKKSFAEIYKETGLGSDHLRRLFKDISPKKPCVRRPLSDDISSLLGKEGSETLFKLRKMYDIRHTYTKIQKIFRIRTDVLIKSIGPKAKRKMKTKEIERQHKIYEMSIIEERSYSEVAEAFGVTRQLVSHVIRRYYSFVKDHKKGIVEKRPINRHLVKRKRWKDLADYFGPSCNYKEVAEELGESYELVHYWFKKLGVIQKTSTFSMRGKWKDLASYFGPCCNYEDIAQHLGVSIRIVSFWFKKFWVKNTGEGTRWRKKDIDWKAIAERENGKCNTVKIAKELGISQGCVYKNLKKIGAVANRQKDIDWKAIAEREGYRCNVVKIAKELGVCVGCVHMNIKKVGAVSAGSSLWKNIDWKKIAERDGYRCNANKVARKLGISHSCVSRNLKKIGVVICGHEHPERA